MRKWWRRLKLRMWWNNKHSELAWSFYHLNYPNMSWQDCLDEASFWMWLIYCPKDN